MKLRPSAYLWAIAGMVSCLVAMMYATAHLFRIEPRMAPGNLNLVMCGLGAVLAGAAGGACQVLAGGIDAMEV